ncbi:HNH endonuclease family protein [Rothia kristinae]|uniref:HNH endonuclease family protein n=1 Tax=Rothia kristinae TaxID=37923 RepID=UPI0022E472C9|nr:HNH endonuclease family protein [Rothia kristinae]
MPAPRPALSRRAASVPVLLAAVVLLVFGLWWRGLLSPPWSGGLGGWGAPREVVLSEATARELAAIPVREKTTSPAYRREAFGQAWADTDRNGCDTRNDILARDLTQVSYKNAQRCAVAGGLLADPYTGRQIAFTAGARSRQVQIDHVVALADAWASGASAWEPRRRTEYANDPENLLAVDGPANEDKGAQDAASWLPPQDGYRCAYAARQIRVKAKYGLSVSPPERAALLEVLGDCPGFALEGG